MNTQPTKAELNETFTYQSEGQLIWIKPPLRSPQKRGCIAGHQVKRGETVVKINGSLFLLHRLIFIYFYGAIPDGLTIDHKDRDPSNNRIENLRLATKKQQQANKLHRGFRIKTSRTIGSKRVSTTWNHSPNFWFATALQARLAYEKKQSQVYGEFFPFCFFTEVIQDLLKDGGPPINTSHSYNFLSN